VAFSERALAASASKGFSTTCLGGFGCVLARGQHQWRLYAAWQISVCALLAAHRSTFVFNVPLPIHGLRAARKTFQPAVGSKDGYTCPNVAGSGDTLWWHYSLLSWHSAFCVGQLCARRETRHHGWQVPYRPDSALWQACPLEAGTAADIEGGVVVAGDERMEEKMEGDLPDDESTVAVSGEGNSDLEHCSSA